MSPTPGSCRGMLPWIVPLLALLFLPPALRSQNPEPAINDLAYDDVTIAALHRIADSLQAIFETLSPSQPLVSDDQAIGSFLQLRGDSTLIAEVEGALHGGASFDDIITRFPGLVRRARRNVVIMRELVKAWTRNGVAHPGYARYFSVLTPGYLGSLEFDDEQRNGKPAACEPWIVLDETEIYEPRDDTTWYRWLTAFEMPHRFARVIIPERYARMIHYLDFMTDTTTEILLDQSRERTRVAGDDYWSRRQRLDTMAHDGAFIAALDSTAEAGIRELVEDMELKQMVARYMPNDRGLELLRRLTPFTGCHGEPDYVQTGAIARLAAVTGRWHLFLRAHLQILGERLAMGNINGGRRAYSYEVEAIGLDLPSLLLGIWFAPAHQHRPWINWHRMVAAMHEAHANDKIEEALLAAMRDRSLDDLSRWKAYDLYFSYIMELSPALGRARLADLRSCADELPDYIREHLISYMLREPGNDLKNR